MYIVAENKKDAREVFRAMMNEDLLFETRHDARYYGVNGEKIYKVKVKVELEEVEKIHE